MIHSVKNTTHNPLQFITWCIISCNQTDNHYYIMTEMKRVIIYGGKTGWIGGLMADLIKKEGMCEISQRIFDVFDVLRYHFILNYDANANKPSQIHRGY